MYSSRDLPSEARHGSVRSNTATLGTQQIMGHMESALKLPMCNAKVVTSAIFYIPSINPIIRGTLCPKIR